MKFFCCNVCHAIYQHIRQDYIQYHTVSSRWNLAYMKTSISQFSFYSFLSGHFLRIYEFLLKSRRHPESIYKKRISLACIRSRYCFCNTILNGDMSKLRAVIPNFLFNENIIFKLSLILNYRGGIVCYTIEFILW